MRTLYLHFGVHRTGTSAIQGYLRQHREEFLKQGILVPYNRGRHIQFVNRLFNPLVSVSAAAKELETLANEEGPAVTSLIISDEDLSFRKDVTRLSDLRKVFEVKIIFSMRRQDLWLESWYFQNVKWQWNKKLAHCSFREFLDGRDQFHWIDYDRYLTHLERVFGQENIITSVMETDQMPGGPIAQFCRDLGLSGPPKALPKRKQNSSFEPEFTEFVRHLPLDQMRGPQRSKLERLLMRVNNQHVLGQAHSNQLVLEHAERRAIMAEFAPGNKRVAQRYFDRDDLFFAPLPAPDAPIAKLEMVEGAGAAMDRYVAPLILEMYKAGLFGKPPQK